MTSQIILQQGPLGVAATVRRPDPKQGPRTVARVADSEESTLDFSPQHQPGKQPSNSRNHQQNRASAPIVSATTLFETSVLSTELMPVEIYASPSPTSPMEAWVPPGSSLSLRDRSV